MKNPGPVNERSRLQHAAIQRMRDSRHPNRARQQPAEMLQSVACLVGAGKTGAARAAIAALDQTRHTLIYLADPTTGSRGIYHQVVTALGGRPAHGSATLAAQAAGLLAAEHGERGRVPVLVLDEAHLLRPRPARGREDPDVMPGPRLCRRSPGMPWRPRSRVSGGRHDPRALVPPSRERCDGIDPGMQQGHGAE